jgi:CBS domain-containing protein
MSKNEDSGRDDAPTSDDDQAVELFMGEEPTMVEPTLSVREAAGRMRDAGVGLLVVGTAAHVQGVVSERDIVRCVSEGIDLDATTVETIESEDLKWATRTASVADVVEEMMENYLRHVLIAGDDGELVGVASMRDLMAVYLS